MKLQEQYSQDDVIEIAYQAYRHGVNKDFGKFLCLDDARLILAGEADNYLYKREKSIENSLKRDDGIGFGSENLARWQNQGGL